ncbi:MAG TPA: hypothetical protein VM573_01425 [Actinomycetota bacterium]|jgi:hypothetical protein|nr:hypothetical protein [Actinomycetota bacterium]
MKRIFSRRSAVTTAFAVGAMFLGIVFAAWTSDGTGSGRAKSTEASALTVTARTGTADLYPGFTGGDVYFTIANPNPYDVTYTAATFGTVTSSDTTACPSLNVVALPAAVVNLTVPANSTGTDLAIQDVVSMLATAPNGCQNKTFDIAITLTQ